MMIAKIKTSMKVINRIPIDLSLNPGYLLSKLVTISQQDSSTQKSTNL